MRERYTLWRAETWTRPGSGTTSGGRWKPPGRFQIDAEPYQRRHVVERCITRRTQFRAVATRYDKRATNSRALTVIAATLIWLSDSPDTA